MCVTETKLDESYKDCEFNLENYRSFRKDNTSMTGGLYASVDVRSDLPCQRKLDLENKTMGSLCIEVTLGKTKWLMVYKIQDIKNYEFEDIVTDMLDNIILDYDRYLVMGDRCKL